MTDAEPDREKARPSAPEVWGLGGLIALLVVIELAILTGSIWDATGRVSRSFVLEYAAFWPGLLRGWTPNYAQQPWLMFLTYGFLHSGWMHLVVNLITLVSLGRIVLQRIGLPKFAILYTGALLGGAVAFGLLATGPQPMVGASGALFGLAGAVLAWDYIDRFSGRLSLWPVARSVALLIALNLVLWWVMDGLLAWQTHFGGFVMGWVVALLLDPLARSE